MLGNRHPLQLNAPRSVPIAAERRVVWRVFQVPPHKERTDLMAAKLTTTEARQGTGPRSMFWVLATSLTLAIIAGLVLGLGWVSLPWSGTP